MDITAIFSHVNELSIPLLTQMPVPKDLALPLPLYRWFLEICLVLLFLIHILFVNLMVGGSILTVLFEILGLKWEKYDTLAKEIGKTITVNKSLAVVFGVGPLLCINLLYTMQFYSANALTGHAWAAIIPLVITAFLLTYLHKYTWDTWTANKKPLHIIVGSLATLLFLFIPLIFLSNINLMLFPDKWTSVSGFFSSLQIGNVFPRYFHFMAASLAITGFFLVGYFGCPGFNVRTIPGLNKAQLKRLFYQVAFWVTLAQFIFGPLLLLTLPKVGLSLNMITLILIGASLAIVLLNLLWKEIKESDKKVGQLFIPILGLFTIIVLCMGTGRHLYRETALELQNALIAKKTKEFRAIEYATNLRIKAGLGAGDALTSGPTPEKVFQNCAACHAVDEVLAAPALTEVYSTYKGNPEGIVEWAKAPGKKRAEFAQMPSFAHLGEEQLMMVSKYMLKLGGEASGEAVEESAESSEEAPSKEPQEPTEESTSEPLSE